MKVELLSSILWDGNHRDAGEVLDISETEAWGLIGRGRAKPYDAPAKPIENRAVGIETTTAEPKIVKRSYKKKTTAK